MCIIPTIFDIANSFTYFNFYPECAVSYFGSMLYIAERAGWYMNEMIIKDRS